MPMRLLSGLLLAGLIPAATADTPAPTLSPLAMVTATVQHEDYEAEHRQHYTYVAQERSERTGNHLWTERIAETNAGKVRMLIAEDGRALSGDRAAGERTRMAEIAAHPDEFARREQARRDDEKHAREMLDLLPKAYVLEHMRPEGKYVRIDFRPNPAYSPRTMEERILQAMSGSLLIEPQALRLRSIEGKLPQDVEIGFGLIATIKAGSSFETTRTPVPGGEWKTHTLNTNVTGRAIFFKSIGKQEHAEHDDFLQVPMDLSVPDAVAMIEKAGNQTRAAGSMTGF